MIAGRVDADPSGDLERLRRQFADWLEGGQDVLTQLARLGGDVEQRRAAADAASREVARLTDDVTSLRHDNDELRAKNAQLASELLRLRKAAERLEAESETVRTHNAALMEERGQTAKLIADKLEDMLAQVLPRLARPLVAGAEPGSPAEAPSAPAAPAATPAPPPAAAREAAPPGADVVAPPAAPALAPSAAIAPTHLSAATLTYVAPGETLADAPDLAPSEAPAVLEPTRPAGPPRVLIVDDESAFTKLLHDHLVTTGYAVLTASSGEEALDALQIFAPRVVLLDMMMAGIGGMETLRRIKAARPDTSVIMITALDDRDVARRAVSAGAADYLTKPLSLDFLDSALALHAAGPLPMVSTPPGEAAADAASAPRRTHFARA